MPSNSGRGPAASAGSHHRENSVSSGRAASDGRAPVQKRAARMRREAGPRENGQGERVRSEHRARSEQGTRAAGEGPAKQGGAPSDKPDVFLHVPDVHVGEIYLDVEDLDAHLSLQAKLANLVQLVAGVHVRIGKVELDIKDVQAQALLKVRLENLYQILDRALTTVERNPEILQGLLNTVDSAVDNVGETAKQAVQPGGAVSELAGDVGEVGRQAVGRGGAATEGVGTVGGTAQEAVRPGGAVAQTAEAVTDAASSAVQPGGAVSEATNAVGDAAERAAESVDDRLDEQKPKRRGNSEARRPRPHKSGAAGSKPREPDSPGGRSATSEGRRKGRRSGHREAES